MESMIKVGLSKSELYSLIAEYEEKIDWCKEDLLTTRNYYGTMALMQEYKDRAKELWAAVYKLEANE